MGFACGRLAVCVLLYALIRWLVWCGLGLWTWFVLAVVGRFAGFVICVVLLVTGLVVSPIGCVCYGVICCRWCVYD